MGLEGRLTIDLSRSGDGTGCAEITSTRPLYLTRAFTGMSLADTVRTIPLLFNVCGMAQGAAATEASEQALAIEVAQPTRVARRLLVLAETAREHMIRAVGDWPRTLGIAKQETALLRILRLWEGLRKAIDPGRAALAIGATASLDVERISHAIEALASSVEETVLGEPIARFEARRTAAELEAWRRADDTPAQKLVGVVAARGWAGAGHADTRFLPELTGTDLAASLLGADSGPFVAAPTWNGLPHETSALGRQRETPLVRDLASFHGNGLLTRLAARLVEMATLPGLMKRMAKGSSRDGGDRTLVHAFSPRPGCGLAHVEAARGRLIHGVEIDGVQVARYAILAPTEWNFHPGGGARHGLAEIIADGRDVREIAELFVGTLDPCVACEVRVH